MGLRSSDAKLDRAIMGMTAQTFPRNPTDLLSFEAPNAEKPFQKVYD